MTARTNGGTGYRAFVDHSFTTLDRQLPNSSLMRRNLGSRSSFSPFFHHPLFRNTRIGLSAGGKADFVITHSLRAHLFRRNNTLVFYCPSSLPAPTRPSIFVCHYHPLSAPLSHSGNSHSSPLQIPHLTRVDQVNPNNHTHTVTRHLRPLSWYDVLCQPVQ